MNIGLVLGGRPPWEGESVLAALGAHYASLGGQLTVLAAETVPLPAEVKRRLKLHAAFHVRTGWQLMPVRVEQAAIGDAALFVLGTDGTGPPEQGLNQSVFAAACTALIGLLLDKGIKPDWLHIHHAAVLPAALLIKKYYKIPYVYSVHSLDGKKVPVSDLTSLGITLPQECATLGGMVFGEQLAALQAESIVAEDTGLLAREWNNFFCAFDGKVITGVPAVDTNFWGETDKTPRFTRREVLLAGLGRGEKPVVVLGEDADEWGLPPDFAVVHPAAELSARRDQLQAADFYLLTGECANPAGLLAAMAAGCVPVAVESIFARIVVRSEDEWPGRENGYLYESSETAADALARAAADLLKRPDWLASLRQRGRDLVKEHYSLQAVAMFYYKVYQGKAAVKLPFIVSGCQL